MIIEAGLVAARFVHYASVMAVFGLALFPLYTYPSRVGDTPARLRLWLRATQRAATLVALISGLAWYLCTAAIMTGSVSGAVDGGALWSVFVETSFGRLWIMRLALATLVLFLLTGTHENRLAPLLSALLLLSLAGVGHTRVSDGASHLVHLLADATHLAAAGAWLGGLLPLGYLLAGVRPSAIREDSRNARIALQRFSGMGSVAVALLVGSGLINSWFLVGSLSALTRTPYGQLLLGKLGLFLSMLVLAALNRFWLVPALARDLSSERPYPDVRRLRYHVLGEQALGLCIVLIVGILGTFHPAIGMPS